MSHVTCHTSHEWVDGSFPQKGTLVLSRTGCLENKAPSSTFARLCVRWLYIALHYFDNTYFVRVASIYSRPSEAPTSPPWLTTLSTRRAPIWLT
jgi:hypothetical protein